MATTGQDFFKFDKDTFNIKFIITDIASLSGYEAYWAASTSPTSSALIERSTTGWDGIDTNGGITLNTTDLVVELTQSDFGVGKLESGSSYYHELTIGEAADGSDSVTVAKGTFTVEPSLFTTETYRSQ